MAVRAVVFLFYVRARHLAGISSVSTFAANAPENDIMEMAISQPVALVFRHPSDASP